MPKKKIATPRATAAPLRSTVTIELRDADSPPLTITVSGDASEGPRCRSVVADALDTFARMLRGGRF